MREPTREDYISKIKDPDVRAVVRQPVSHTDPNGSYTGKPAQPGETPQQDADDL